MKISLVTPHYHQSRGNTVTVNRLAEGLRRAGHSIRVLSSTEEPQEDVCLDCELVHGFNAYYFYAYWLTYGKKNTPFLITMTGTDLNHALLSEQTREQVLRCLQEARVVHVFNQQARELLWRQAPWTEGKTVLIPQGIHVLPDTKHIISKEEGSFVFLLPAGIRRVKQVPAAIDMLAALHEEAPSIRLWIVGPVLEEEEGRLVEELVRKHGTWVRYLGQAAHEEMGAIYRQADVVLNTSLSEGQSAAILEAMSLGIPVLASDIPGNKDVVTHELTGLLYHDRHQFIDHARRLMAGGQLRAKLGQAGVQYIEKHHSTERELQSLEAAYRQALERSRT